jgi:hypothetical protein
MARQQNLKTYTTSTGQKKLVRLELFRGTKPTKISKLD